MQHSMRLRSPRWLLSVLLVASAVVALLSSGGPVQSVSAVPVAADASPPLVCLNGGVLLRTRDPSDHSLVRVQCACTEGWSGLTCDFRDWCAAGPCLNGGQCFNTRTAALCHCTEDWTGSTCEQPSPCKGDPCSGHGECLLREDRSPPPSSAAAASAATLPERRAAARGRSKPAAHKPSSSSTEHSGEDSTNSTSFRHFEGRVTGRCKCEPGWTGTDCSQRHTEVCAAVNKCTIFNAQADADGTGALCGCESAIAEHDCTWCLEQGVAYAPDDRSAGASSCLAPLRNVAQCPPAAAQAIPSCKLMDGTPFGWCVVGAGPLGYAVDGNPTAPTAGSRGCRHWIWNLDGCKADWGTRVPDAPTGAAAVQTPSLEDCLAVPPCSDAETAGSSLCGCQAAMSIGCTWCLEQQMAYPPSASSGGGDTSSSSCRAMAKDVTMCPSQQAQTVHQCVGVGGTPYGWCSIDETEPSMGYSLDGSAKSPASNPKQCNQWFFFSNACPERVSPGTTLGGGGGGRNGMSVAALVSVLGEREGAAAAADGHDSANAAAGGDNDDEPALTAKQRLEAERDAVTPPTHLSHVLRNYLLVWLALVSLALLLRWLPHYLERNEYQSIRDKPQAAAFAARDNVADVSSTL